MMQFNDLFLQANCENNYTKLDSIRKRWDMSEEEFVNRVDNWFENFNELNEKELALKVLDNINYYSPQRLEMEIKKIDLNIRKLLIRQNLEAANILLIVPNERGDSADMLSYLTKEWGITQSQIKTVNEIKETVITDKSVLIAFNDTHGTGNQFVNSILKQLKPIIHTCPLYVIGITITESALKYLKYEFENVIIITTTSPKIASKIFTQEEYTLLEELCSDVYPPHPLGYGRAGLLTAYYYQCPNNTLPIIWANSRTQNNFHEGSVFPWIPLFEYKPKPKKEQSLKQVKNSPKPLFNKRTRLDFSADELKIINETIEQWRCGKIMECNLVKKLDKWFENFSKNEKELSLKVFTSIHFLSLVRLREEIRELRNKVVGNIRRKFPKDTKSDILFVLTGDELETKYHYVFEFLRIWGLKTSQAIPLDYLLKHPYESIGKHLVYFYHTRIHKGETFVTKIWNSDEESLVSGMTSSGTEKLTAKDLPAKSHNVLSFMLSKQTEKMLKEIKKDAPNPLFYFYSEEVSKPMHEMFDENEIAQLKVVYERNDVHPGNIENKFLTAYYFNCPKDTLSLLWYDKKFAAIFQSRE